MGYENIHCSNMISVHFRVRAIDQHRPKSLSPSTSGITYWQIEAEHSILDGEAASFPFPQRIPRDS